MQKIFALLWICPLLVLAAAETRRIINQTPLKNDPAHVIIRDTVYRWPNSEMIYQFTDIPQIDIDNILDAMEAISNRTCVTFKARTTETDYVSFIDDNSGCYSTSIGRAGGQQVINMSPGCHQNYEMSGIAQHEILHALGIQHEMTRPGRNKFINVLWENIDPTYWSQYQERSDFNYDSVGTPYDYGSVMHYSTGGFSIGGPTMEILKPYSGQIGQRSKLSNGDVERVLRMQNCPANKGKKGKLSVRIKRATDFSTPTLGVPNSYVRVAVMKSDGKRVRKYTSIKPDTMSPEWFETLNFGLSGNLKWRFMRITAFHSADGVTRSPLTDEKVTIQETMNLKYGARNKAHCYYPERRQCGFGKLRIRVKLE